jgi:hypothetical protein
MQDTLNRGVIPLLMLSIGSMLAGCGSPEPPPEVNVERHDWTPPDGTSGQQLITDHYDIRTTSRDAMTLSYVAPFMETAYAGYTGLVPPPGKAPDRLVVYLFGTRPEWAAFTRRNFPGQARTYLHIHAGGFMDQGSASCVLYDVGREATLALLAHEGFHQYVARVLADEIPPWLNEGLATQWEAFALEGDRPVFMPRRNFERRNDLRDALGAEGGFIPLADLLRMHAGQAVVKTGQTVRTYYAQVWSTVLFIREGPRSDYAEGLQRLLADAANDRLDLAVSGYRAATPGAETLSSGEVVFRHYITEDLSTFMSEYEAFAEALVR